MHSFRDGSIVGLAVCDEFICRPCNQLVIEGRVNIIHIRVAVVCLRQHNTFLNNFDELYQRLRLRLAGLKVQLDLLQEIL